MLFQNDIFHLNGSTMRLLHVDAGIDQSWCIAIDDELAWPQAMPFSEISSFPHVKQDAPSTVTFSKARLKKCDAAWDRLQPLLTEHRDNLFLPSHRSYAIQTHAEKVGCSQGTLRKDLRRYWQRGMTKFALLPEYDKSGRAVSAD